MKKLRFNFQRRGGCGFRQEQAHACLGLKEVLIDSEGSYFRFKGRTRDGEFRSCASRACDPAFRFCQCRHDNFLFAMRVKSAKRSFHQSCALSLLAPVVSQPGLIHGECIAFAHDNGSFYDVLQLPNVAGPIVDLQNFEGSLRNVGDGFSRLLRIPVNEIFDEKRNVIQAFPQRGHFDRKDVEPVE